MTRGDTTYCRKACVCGCNADIGLPFSRRLVNRKEILLQRQQAGGVHQGLATVWILLLVCNMMHRNNTMNGHLPGMVRAKYQYVGPQRGSGPKQTVPCLPGPMVACRPRSWTGNGLRFAGILAPDPSPYGSTTSGCMRNVPSGKVVDGSLNLTEIQCWSIDAYMVDPDLSYTLLCLRLVVESTPKVALKIDFGFMYSTS